MRSILILLICVSLAGVASATRITVTGCNNGSYIYITSIGYTEFSGEMHQVYDSNGQKIRIYNNEDGKDSPKCNEVAAANISNNYNSPQCWINSYVNPKNNSTGASWQTNTVITYDDCSTLNMPLDDYIPLLILLVGSLGAIFIKKQLLGVS